MAIRNVTMRNALANQYKTTAPFGALFSADPGTADAATNELTGGGYARQAANWGTAASSAVVSGSMAFSVAVNAVVAYFGVAASGTAGTADVKDSASVTSQTFSSAGTYTVTSATFTVT